MSENESKRIDPFDISNACIEGRFNPNHPNISRVYTNVNLDRGEIHWSFRSWNPTFGNIHRYSLVEWVGDGRYSDVFTCLQDNYTKCAVKLLKPVNPDRVRRELKVLTEIQGHPNVLKLLDIVIDPKNGIPAMITEFVPCTPWRVLFQNFDLTDISFYLYRICQALDHTHSCGIMHRDVKPLNILCEDPKKLVILADWGLAEFYHPMRKYVTHVATRYYKAPEILLGYEYYDYSIDMWAVGVMLLEMLTLKIHIFDGLNNEHQIDSIAEIIGGKPILEWADKYRVVIPNEKKLRLSQYPGKLFSSLIPPSRHQFHDSKALDLLERLLTVDQKQRISAAEALLHPFFEQIRQYDASHAQNLSPEKNAI